MELEGPFYHVHGQLLRSTHLLLGKPPAQYPLSSFPASIALQGPASSSSYVLARQLLCYVFLGATE